MGEDLDRETASSIQSSLDCSRGMPLIKFGKNFVGTHACVYTRACTRETEKLNQ